MREGGLEPPSLSAPDPKSGASASFATLALPRQANVRFGGDKAVPASGLTSECDANREPGRELRAIEVDALPLCRTYEESLRAEQPVVVEKDAERRRVERLAHTVDNVAVPKHPEARAEGNAAKHDFTWIISILEIRARESRIFELGVRCRCAQGHPLGDSTFDLDRENVERNSEWIDGDVAAIWNRDEPI